MKKLLVVRNDKIGDFMLAWPGFAMLKLSLPDVQISALVPAYTAPLAEACPWIDEVILDPGEQADKAAQRQLLAELKAAQFDAAVCFFSTMRNALLMWRAGIPIRLAPATKLAQLFYNQRLTQRRSQSAKPEWQYNLDLSRDFLARQGVTPVEPPIPQFQPDPAQVSAYRDALQAALPGKQAFVFVHTGSGGSANNLSLTQYQTLIAELAATHPQWGFVLTAGPSEKAVAEQLCDALHKQDVGVSLAPATADLTAFFHALGAADLFMAGSTGPLHMASALDVPTVGFFPSKRSATPLRWRPLNSEGNHLAFAPPAGEQTQEDMSLIEVQTVAAAITTWWSGRQPV